MKYLYILKHKDYKLYPINLQLLTNFPNNISYYNCVYAFWSYIEAKKAKDYYLKHYHLDLDIVRFEVNKKKI